MLDQQYSLEQRPSVHQPGIHSTFTITLESVVGRLPFHQTQAINQAVTYQVNTRLLSILYLIGGTCGYFPVICRKLHNPPLELAT